MSYKHLSGNQIHQVGVYLAATEAIVHGHKVRIVEEPRRYRMRVNGRLVQVFTIRAGDWSVTDWQHPLSEDTTAAVLLDLKATEPQFFIVPGDWFREDVRTHHEAFLSAHGGERPRTPDAGHSRIEAERVEQWHNRWDVLA